MKTTIASPAMTATLMAPTTASAERKLVSSIRALTAARIRSAGFTTQHDTGTNTHMRRNRTQSLPAFRAAAIKRPAAGSPPCHGARQEKLIVTLCELVSGFPVSFAHNPRSLGNAICPVDDLAG
jgi:hypothetical protein